MAGLNFNAATVAPKMGMDPIPQGTYRVAIVKSEHKEPVGKAPYLYFGFQVIEGEQKGRYINVNLNLEHDKESVRQMAMGELSCICHACGVVTIQDSQDLHNIPMEVDVVVTPPKDGYDAGNKIKQYRSLGQTAQLAPKVATNSPFLKKS